MRRFKSGGQAQRFLAAQGLIRAFPAISLFAAFVQLKSAPSCTLAK